MGTKIIEQLWDNYQKSKGVEDRNRLVEVYLPVARYHAAKVYAKLPKCVEFDDILQMANRGLIRAVERFKPALGYSFKTYCARPIRGAILDELREQDWVPRSTRAIQKAVDVIQRELENAGKEPTPYRISKKLNMKPTQFMAIEDEIRPRAVFGYSSLASESTEEEHVNIMADERAVDPSEVVVNADLRERLNKILPKLTPRQAEIIKNYFWGGLSERKIAKKLHLSQQAVHNLKLKALRHFRAGK